jgi:integrase
VGWAIYRKPESTAFWLPGRIWVGWAVLKANGLKWKGWHAYRRGLATNLHELGVPDKVIQANLRHEDVKTTQRSYIKTVPSVVTNAMKRLEEKIASAADVQQVAVN